jgi:hypothetical protein
MQSMFYATVKRSAITAGDACRPERSQKADKRMGYLRLAAAAP